MVRRGAAARRARPRAGPLAPGDRRRRLVGNAISEPGVGAIDRYRTTLVPDGEDLRLDGTKYYSTGSLYADYIVVAADRDGERVAVLVDADAAGVTQHDDWDGFGQRLTASGTTEFHGVSVPGDRILGPGYGTPGRTYGTSYLQLVQLSVLAGIAQRATDDVADWVRDAPAPSPTPPPTCRATTRSSSR